jgi:peptide-methionine (R)-S-oxide reductase
VIHTIATRTLNGGRFFVFFLLIGLLSSQQACQTAQQRNISTPVAAPVSLKTTAGVDSIVPPATLDGALVRVEKSAAEWKSLLSEQEYYVLREEGTERAFSGDLWNHHGTGVYTCRGCALPLFESKTKFDSGTGWPSFYAPIVKMNVQENEDRAYGMLRVEVECARCGGHLGHVFDDGPRPTGLRYCINSVSLDFVAQ